MSSSIDFVVRKGLLERKQRRWWQAQRLDLPDPGLDEILILIDRSGIARTAADVTPGEMRLSEFKGWALVNAAPKTLSLELTNQLSTDVATFNVLLRVNLIPTGEPHELVGLLATDVGTEVEIQCRKTVAVVLNKLRLSGLDQTERVRTRAEAELLQLLGQDVATGTTSLRGRIASIVVASDVQTDAYINKVRAVRQDRELIKEQGANTLAETDAELKRRAAIRENLAPHLTNSAMAMLETIYTDPSPDRIAAVLAKTEERDRDRLDRFVTIVTDAMRNKVVVDEESFIQLARESWTNLDRQTATQSLEAGASEPDTSTAVPKDGDLPGEAVDSAGGADANFR